VIPKSIWACSVADLGHCNACSHLLLVVEPEASIARGHCHVTVVLGVVSITTSTSIRSSGWCNVVGVAGMCVCVCVCVCSGWFLFADSRGDPHRGWGVKMAPSQISRGARWLFATDFRNYVTYR
jgi:hypothetical protein